MDEKQEKSDQDAEVAEEVIIDEDLDNPQGGVPAMTMKEEKTSGGAEAPGFKETPVKHPAVLPGDPSAGEMPGKLAEKTSAKQDVVDSSVTKSIPAESPKTPDSPDKIPAVMTSAKESALPAIDSAGKTSKDIPESNPETLDLKGASELAKKKLSEALGKPANATISIEDEGEFWLAVVEIVEEEYLPGQNLKSMNDLLGVYEVKLGKTGNLLKWTRKNSYKRAEVK
jgi:hypothetical protein